MGSACFFWPHFSFFHLNMCIYVSLYHSHTWHLVILLKIDPFAILCRSTCSCVLWGRYPPSTLGACEPYWFVASIRCWVIQCLVACWGSSVDWWLVHLECWRPWICRAILWYHWWYPLVINCEHLQTAFMRLFVMDCDIYALLLCLCIAGDVQLYLYL